MSSSTWNAPASCPTRFYADNIRRLRPLETHEWWYTREFIAPAELPAQRWDLVFAGLDTLATVWLNGVEVGQCGQHADRAPLRRHGALRPGAANNIAVRLGSALNQRPPLPLRCARMSWEQREEGLFIRKAPHVWGWDIMPRAVSAGIWRPCCLETRPDDAIEQLYYWTASVGPSRATLGVRFQFRTR